MVRVDDSAAVSDRGYSIELKICGPARGLPNEFSMAHFSERRVRRGGRVVDGSGLEIRIQDFGLIWTGLDGSVLLS